MRLIIEARNKIYCLCLLVQHIFIECNLRKQPLAGYIAPLALCEQIIS